MKDPARLSAPRLMLLLAAAAVVPACSKGSSGATGAAGPPGVVIHSITATPPVLRPGDDTVLSVSATDGSGGALSYAWSAPFGSLVAAVGNSVTWTSPDATGGFLVNVTVSNAAGATAVGYVSLLVTVGPTGPIIVSVNPSDSWVGDEVRITGAGFGNVQGTSTVTFQGVAATVISWTDTIILATTPAGSAGAADVLVTIAGVASSPGYVTVSPCIPISTTNADEEFPLIVPDGSGGAILAWGNSLSGAIFAQRVDGTGAVQWTADGVPVCAFASPKFSPQIAPDGLGGAIIVWKDGRAGTHYDIYAQRLNGAGALQWTADGVPVCSAAADQDAPQLVSDGSGGVIIVWDDFRSGTNLDIYAQRMNAAGAAQWAVDGVPVCATADSQSAPQLAPDGAGGAVIAWLDFRSGTSIDLYAQRVDGAGANQWTAVGVPVCIAPGLQSVHRLASDGSSGAIIAWEDNRGVTDVYAQRMNAAGTAQWAVDGVPVSTFISAKTHPQLLPDGSGGAIIAWRDISTNSDIRAQRVNAAGAAQWTVAGIPLCAVSGDQTLPQIAPDGSGGAIIAWQDLRGISADIYAQRVDPAGTVQWAADGVPVITAINDQTLPRIAPGASGASIIVWQDLRNGVTNDIYAQRLTAAGSP